jgi:predicted HicB family RNase H-like nuclease
MLTEARNSVSHYRYTVGWSHDDGEHVATVAEFPSLSFLASTQDDALAGLLEVVQDVVDDLVESGEEVPLPLAEREFSGNIRLRVTPEKHRELATRALEQGVSLNRYLNSLLP